MKILFIHNKYLLSAGGEDTTVDAEVKLLLSYGHNVRVLLFDNDRMGKGIPTKVKAGFESIYNPTSSKIVRKEIKAFAPDVVHIHNFYFTASPSVIIAAHRLGVPVVMTIQNYRLICANCLLLRNNTICELCVHHTFPWYGVAYKCYHDSAIQSAVVGSIGAIHKLIGTWQNKVDRYIAPAEFIKSKLIDSSLRLPPAKVEVKRNFVEAPGIGSQNEREDFFLFIGRLSKEKGVYTLLKCFNDLQHIKLIIAGDGPEREALSLEFGHLSNVQFRGHLAKPELMQLLKTCKASIFPSIWYEGLPLSIIEALATGTPVIASRLGAMQEMIQHGENGLLFEPGDHVQLQQLITFFYQHPGESFYKAAYESYKRNFHPEKCYEDVMKIYKAAISAKMSKFKE
ncbi:MAG TPA: glycosyltransferase family 4 protein [Flavitalea sp.]|nr:glycosyltransferase family 4 protein [Flavitalea sp.]